MSLRAVFSYQNLDSTADLNLRFEKLVSKGVFYGGSIVANGTTNTVTVNPFRAATFDGMVVLDTASTSITVTGNQKSYICLLAMYNTSSNPTMNWVVHTQATYNADPNRDYLICFGTVDLSGSAGPVFSNLVSYQERNIVSLIGRDGFLGTYSTLPALQSEYPATAPVLQRDNDVALVSQGVSGLPTWYRWNNTSGAFVAFGTYADDIAAFTEHVNNDTLHTTANQKAALAGTSGVPSPGNKFVTESDTDRTLSTSERAALSNAVGLGAGLSESNPLVADSLAVVSQVLMQKIADGSNVISINAASFGDLTPSVYVGRQGIDSTGKSSAAQYFSVEDLFGDGLAPVVDGVESPVTIMNIGWNAPTGSTLNPSSNAQVDAQGFLTVNAGQTLYITVNVNLPSSTQYNIRLNVKGRVRDLSPAWGNPLSFPVRAAATAFRNGRQPFVIANTGDFKSFRVGEATKANLFISADQTNYPSYGNVSLGIYAGSTLKGLIRMSAGTSGALDVQNDVLMLRFGLSASWASTYLYASMLSNSVFVARELKGVSNDSIPVASRTPTYILNNETGSLHAGLQYNTILGVDPTHTFVSTNAVGLGVFPAYACQDQGGTVTYVNSLHLRSGATDLTSPGHFDIFFVRSPESNYESEADVAESSLIFHKSSNASDTSVTYTMWAKTSLNGILGFACNDGRSPSPILFVAPNGTYDLPGVASVGYAMKAAENTLFSKSVAVAGNLMVKGSLRTYSGLNNTTAPAIAFNTLYNNTLHVAGALSLTTSLIRLGSDTMFGTALYACDNTDALRASLAFGVSDMLLLGSASSFGSVRLGPAGYQLMWGKETPSSAVSPHIVIEEAASATRELIIGRRGYNNGSFDYATAIRIKNGVIKLPFVAEGAAMLTFGDGVGFLGLSSEGVIMECGGHVVSLTETSFNIGQEGSSGAPSILGFSGYGTQTMLSNIWVLHVGTSVNDAINFGGTAGQMALYPNVTNVTDLGTQANVFRNLYTTTVVTPNFSMDYQGSISPRVNNVGALGAPAARFSYAYVSNLDSITFGNAGISFGATAAIPTDGVAYSIGTSGSPLYNVSALTLEAVTFKNQGISFGINSALPTAPNVYSIGSDTRPLKSVVTEEVFATRRRSGYLFRVIQLDSPADSDHFVNLSTLPFVQTVIVDVLNVAVAVVPNITTNYVTLPTPTAGLDGVEMEVLVRFRSIASGAIAVNGLSSKPDADHAYVQSVNASASANVSCVSFKFKCVSRLQYKTAELGVTYDPGDSSWVCTDITTSMIYS